MWTLRRRRVQRMGTDDLSPSDSHEGPEGAGVPLVLEAVQTATCHGASLLDRAL